MNLRRIGVVSFILVFCVLFTINISADLQFQVTKLKVTASPSNFSGDCPHTINFKAYITVNRPGSVQFKWIKSHNQPALTKVHTMKFESKGTKTVTSKWELGEQGKQYKNYWKKVEVLSPNRILSNAALFTLNCPLKPVNEMQARIFRFEISGAIDTETSSNILQGRKVKIKLKKGGRTIHTLQKTLNSSSHADYKFVIRLTGDYVVTVERGDPDPDNYASDARVCFDRTIPDRHTISVVSERSKYENNNFEIRYTIGHDTRGICW